MGKVEDANCNTQSKCLNPSSGYGYGHPYRPGTGYAYQQPFNQYHSYNQFQRSEYDPYPPVGYPVAPPPTDYQSPPQQPGHPPSPPPGYPSKPHVSIDSKPQVSYPAMAVAQYPPVAYPATAGYLQTPCQAYGVYGICQHSYPCGGYGHGNCYGGHDHYNKVDDMVFPGGYNKLESKIYRNQWSPLGYY